jgi:type I restriction enzyme M protein
MKSNSDDFAGQIWKAFDATRSLFRSDQAYPYTLGIIGLKSLSDRGGDDVVRWNEIVSEPYDMGSALNAALSRVKAAYPEYQGWFDDLDYNLKAFGGHQPWNRLWQPVVSAISEIDFARMLSRDPQALHRLCIKLSELVSQDSGAKGVFETSESLAALMSVLLAPRDGQTVYDPFCRGGATLLSAVSLARDRDPGAHLDLYAQTPYHEAAQNIQLNMFVVGERDIHVAIGDVIRNPGFTDGRNVKAFDRILCTTPLGAKNWGEEIAQYDPFGRFIYGIPPATQGDFAYLQHCIASLADDGVLVAVVSPSLLFKERREGEIRRRIVEVDLVEAVISLPPKLLLQTSISTALLVIRRTKPEDRKGKVLFVNASKGFLPGRSQNTLRDEDVTAIQKAYSSFNEIEGYSAVCSIKTIAEHDFGLEVSGYVIETPDLEVKLDLDGAIRELDNLHDQHTKRYEEMSAMLAKLIEYMEGD